MRFAFVGCLLVAAACSPLSFLTDLAGQVLQPRNLPVEELKKEFEKIDTNHDGALTLDEYKSWPDQNADALVWREKAFKGNLDGDGDGYVLWLEYLEANKRVPKLVTAK